MVCVVCICSAAPAVAFPSRLMSERMGISEACSSMSSWLYGSSRVVSSVIEPVVVLHLSSIIWDLIGGIARRADVMVVLAVAVVVPVW